MKWLRLQKLVEALLTGDHTLVKDAEVRLALLEYALEQTAEMGDSLVLYREGEEHKINSLRQSGNGYIVRATLPERDDDIIDIDQGLTFAVARFMASYVSKEKFSLHEKRAIDIVQMHNNKLSSYREQVG
jgi:hypothetical protein